MRKRLAAFLLLWALMAAATSTAPAQDQTPDKKSPSADELQSRIERLEKQNQELIDLIKGGQLTRTQAAPNDNGTVATTAPAANSAALGAPVASVGAVSAPAAASPEGYKVGTSLGMTLRWKDYGVWAETANKDFTAHVGGWFQYDNVWWNQTKGTQANVGDFTDGGFFRRVRLQMDGTYWQVGEYNMILGFENTQRSVVSIFELWAGIKDVPVLGMLRFGRMVTPQGLEGDDTTTNKSMTFLERSSMSDAFYQNFATGTWQGNSVFDQRFCYQSMIYRPDIAGSNSGDSFGDGEYAASARLTGLPIYENDGRCLVHLGASASWRDSQKGGNELGGPSTVRFRARPEQRDFSADVDGTTHDGVLNPGDANRIVDTGAIVASGALIYGTEFAAILGPFSIQGEYAWTFAEDAVVGGHSVGDIPFSGGYVQVSYFLTGENRTYDKRLGRFAPTYMTGPNTPFWFVRDSNGGYNAGLGAWEIAARYSYLDLNGSSGGATVQGGVMEGTTIGLNWYWNPNFKIQFQYIHDTRSNLATGQVPGFIDGIGIRTQLSF